MHACGDRRREADRSLPDRCKSICSDCTEAGSGVARAHERPGHGDDAALLVALRDVGQRARESWMAAFTYEVARWLDSHLWEQGNREAGRVPPLEDYFAMRPLTIGMYFEFLLSEVTASYSLSAKQRLSPEAVGLARIASNEIAWTNDILTLEKELLQGDVHNGVLCIMQSRGLALDPALAEAIDMHNREAKAFVGLGRSR